jgi:hypothetical protein
MRASAHAAENGPGRLISSLTIEPRQSTRRRFFPCCFKTYDVGAEGVARPGPAAAVVGLAWPGLAWPGRARAWRPGQEQGQGKACAPYGKHAMCSELGMWLAALPLLACFACATLRRRGPLGSACSSAAGAAGTGLLAAPARAWRKMRHSPAGCVVQCAHICARPRSGGAVHRGSCNRCAVCNPPTAQEMLVSFPHCLQCCPII